MAKAAHLHSLKITVAGAGRRRARRKDPRTLVAGLALLVGGGLLGDLERQPVPSLLAMSPATLQFAPQAINSTSPPLAVTLSNPGTVPADVGALALSNPAGFSSDLRDCPDGRVLPGRSCVVLVTFHPFAAGESTGTLEHTATAQRVALKGSALLPPAPVLPPPAPPAVALKPPPPVSPPRAATPAPPRTAPVQPVRAAQFTRDPFLYGSVEVAAARSERVVLRNTGEATLDEIRLRLEGDHMTDFQMATDLCVNLAPASDCVTTVQFVPREEGTHTATLIASAGGRILDRATLNGVGAPQPRAQIAIAPNPVQFSSQARDAAITVSNQGAAPLRLDGFALDNGKDFQVVARGCELASPLNRGESCQVALRFKGRGSAQGLLTVKHNDPLASTTVVLAAEVSRSKMNKWVTGLLVGGAITAAVAVAATRGDSPAAHTEPDAGDGSVSILQRPTQIDSPPAPAKTPPPRSRSTADGKK